ncbi:MAG: carboxypeptidase-like regulatory domain-containing protein [Bacteroidota bacterium]
MTGRLRLGPLFMMILFLSPPLQCQDSIPEIHVTVSSKSRTINQVLDEITLQTGYNFTYNAGLITGKQRIQFSVEELLLEKTLDSLLQNPQLAYREIDRNIVIYKKNETAPIPINPEFNRIIFKGRVLDSRSGKPLPYATIALFGTSQGSICNQEGAFSFKIPERISDPLLVVSYMGYKRLLLPVSYPVEEEISILLEREMIPLQEVIIRFADPELLLIEAMSRIPSNYLDDHATMTAFYRESVKRNDHCMVYSEAVLDVAKGPYSKNSTGDRVRIRKGRKIADVSTKDTVLIKHRSGIYTSLSLDVIKERPDFLADDFLDRYDLEFTDLMTYGERLVYVISFRQKSNISALLFSGQLYLDQEHLALLAADFEYNPEMIHKEPGLFLVSRSPKIRIRPTLARYHVDYREMDGKYHVSQVRAEVEFKVRKRRQWIGARYRISLEMAITDVIPGQRLRIKASERVSPNSVLSDESFQFDPSFWGIYNTIKPEASLRESIQRLEQNLQQIND